MTLKRHYAFCFKTHASFGAPQTFEGRCSAVTVVFGNIWFMRIFAGERRRRTIVWLSKTSIFSPFGLAFSLIAKYVTLSRHFTIHFHYYEQRCQKIYYILIVEHIYWIFFVVSRRQQRCAAAYRDPQNIWDPQKCCGSFVDEKLRALHCRSVNK